jgi:hypothetical protein
MTNWMCKTGVDSRSGQRRCNPDDGKPHPAGVSRSAAWPSALTGPRLSPPLVRLSGACASNLTASSYLLIAGGQIVGFQLKGLAFEPHRQFV